MSKFPELVFGAIFVFILGVSVGSVSPFDIVSHLDKHEGSYVALFTLLLAAFTWMVRQSGERQITLIEKISEHQANESQTLQRAYLGTRPRGLHAMSDGTVIAYVVFENGGNLPVKNLRNQVRIGWFEEGEKSEFAEVNIVEPGSAIVLPKSHIERGTGALSDADAARYRSKEGYVYVWGRAEYDEDSATIDG